MEKSNPPVCPKCRKNPSSWNNQEEWWEICSSCKCIENSDSLAEILVDIGFSRKHSSAELTDFNKEIVEDIQKKSGNFVGNNIVIQGNSGAGKTWFISAVAKEILKRGITHSDIKFTNNLELFEYLASDYSLFHELVEENIYPKYLFFDDMLKPKTDTEARLLTRIFEVRRNEQLITHVTTNYPLEDIQPQILSRLLDNEGNFIVLNSNNWRKK